MRKINLLFPLMFVLALAGSAFTRQSTSTQKAKSFGTPAYYQDPYGYCDDVYVDDTNCSYYYYSYVCEEFVIDNGEGWTVMYQNGTATVCWNPLYSLYPNNP